MEIQIEHAAPRLSAKLHRVLQKRFVGEPRAIYLGTEFLAHTAYNRGFATKLLAFARESQGGSWNVRLFAALMLANQCLRLTLSDAEEFKFLFAKIGLLSPKRNRMMESVLREGYTSTDFQAFVPEFLENLNRLERIHREIQGR